MGYIKNNRYAFYTFFMAFVIMTSAFANEKLFPFGNNQIMIIDSWHQYYPFLQLLQQKLIHGESLFYSWNTGGGTNFLALMAYYAMSPLYLLSVLFPKEYLREFMLLATIVKISLAGTFFTVYIRGLYGRNDIGLTIFGLMYGFSGYAMGYYWDIMWLDGMALLPLIILGLHRLLDEERFVLYTVTLTLAMISSFYIGYFICEFILIYAVLLYFMKYAWHGLRHFLVKMKDVALYSAISLGLAAITLVPTFYGLRMAYGLSSGDPQTVDTYYSILDICNNLLANVPPTIKNGMPNIYSGILALIMVIFYFLGTSVPLRHKVLNFSLLLFFLFSFNINYMDFVWHGFHFPNEVPHRFAFLFSFVILTLAYQAYLTLDEIREKTVFTVVLALIGYLIVCEKLYTETFDFKVFYVSMVLVMIYGGAILLFKYGKLSAPVFTGFLCYVIVGEMILSALNATHTAGNSGRNDYPAQNDAVQKAVAELYASDPSFYRLEMFRWYTVNDPALYGYRGVSQFASTSNSKLNTYAHKIGLSADPGSNTILYSPTTPVINGLFAVKYMLSRGDAIALPNAAYDIVSRDKGLTVLQNKFPLPLGFMMNATARSWKTESISPFVNQENFLKLATGKANDVFRDFPAVKESYDNMRRTRLDEGMRYHYNNIDKSQKGYATVSFTAPETGQIYVYMLNQSRTVTVTVRGKSSDYETRRGVIIDLGIMQAGEDFDMDFEVPAAEKGFFDIQAVMFNGNAFDPAYQALADEPFEVREFSDTRVAGTVEAKAAGILYTSIPYEKGWTVKLDGQKVTADPFMDAMISLPLTKGQHLIEFTYIPNGLLPGAAISALSLLAFALSCRMLSKKKRGVVAESAETDDSDENMEGTEDLATLSQLGEAESPAPPANNP